MSQSLQCVLARMVHKSRLVIEALGQCQMFIEGVLAPFYVELFQGFDVVRSQCMVIFRRFTAKVAQTLTSIMVVGQVHHDTF